MKSQFLPFAFVEVRTSLQKLSPFPHSDLEGEQAKNFEERRREGKGENFKACGSKAELSLTT